MISRRHLLSVAPVAALGSAAAPRLADAAPAVCPAVVDPFGLLGPEEDPEVGPAISGVPWAGQAPLNDATAARSPWNGQMTGRGAPRGTDVATAFRLLFDAPRGDPLTVARYFENLSKEGAPRGSTGQPFNTEWVGLANPLIVGFFGLTLTRPALNNGLEGVLNSDGDQTAWCSAFMTFCLYASGYEGAFTALSNGYRKYGAEAAEPRPGDIAVFEQRGDPGRRGKGHVAFFLSETATRVTVLGGNQGPGGRSSVNTTSFPKEGKDLRLRTIRRPFRRA